MLDTHGRILISKQWQFNGKSLHMFYPQVLLILITEEAYELIEYIIMVTVWVIVMIVCFIAAVVVAEYIH